MVFVLPTWVTGVVAAGRTGDSAGACGTDRLPLSKSRGVLERGPALPVTPDEFFLYFDFPVSFTPFCAENRVSRVYVFLQRFSLTSSLPSSESMEKLIPSATCH